MCLRCLCRRREDDDDDDDAESEDSEMYWIRTRREERQRNKTKERDEFLNNVLRTKRVVLAVPTEHDGDISDEFVVQEAETCCAICLVDYEEGETICLSHNPKCTHHFHKECIQSWLSSHDQCPCCRNDYLAFSDDEEDGSLDDQPTAPVSVTPLVDDIPSWALFETRGASETDLPSNSLHSDGDGGMHTDSNAGQLSVGQYQEEPWEVTLERTMDRVRRQVENQLDGVRRQLRQRRETNRDSPDEQRRIERSMELVRHQLTRVREAASREIQARRNAGSSRSSTGDATNASPSEARWENALQVVRTRLQDINNSESASRLRERSSRTMQRLIRQPRQNRQTQPSGS